jgi:hypothetical protein
MQAIRSFSQDGHIFHLKTLGEISGEILLFHPVITNSACEVDFEDVLVRSVNEFKADVNHDSFIAFVDQKLLLHLQDPFTVIQDTRQIHATEVVDLRDVINQGWKYVHWKHAALAIDLEGQGVADTLLFDLRSDEVVDSSVINRAFWSGIRSSFDPPEWFRRTYVGWAESVHPAYIQTWTRDSLNLSLAQVESYRPHTVIIVNNSTALQLQTAMEVIALDPKVTLIWENVASYWKPSSAKNSGELWYRVNTRAALWKGRRILMTKFLSGRLSMNAVLERTRGRHPFLEDALERQYRFSYPRKGPLDKTYSTNRALSLGERLLALFKIHAVVKYFYPHHEMISPAWHNLDNWIKAFTKAETLENYQLTLMQYTHYLRDSHVKVSHVKPRGKLMPRLIVDRIRDTVVVVYSEIKNIRPGDIIEKVNGETVHQLQAFWGQFLSTSTREEVIPRLFGTRFSPGLLFLGDSTDTIELTLNRVDSSFTASVRPADTPTNVYGLLLSTRTKSTPDSLLYLMPSGIQSLNEIVTLLRDSAYKGIVIDIRSPNVGRININMLIPFFCTNSIPLLAYVPVIDQYGSSLKLFDSLYTRTMGLNYKGPIVILIDKGVMSAQESFCLRLKVSRDVVFIGRASAGCTGAYSEIFLPRGQTVHFTGTRVLLPDGTSIQGQGIQPDILFEPTILGLSAERDELIEAGFETLRIMIRNQSHR